jgi:hypothetical protein
LRLGLGWSLKETGAYIPSAPTGPRVFVGPGADRLPALQYHWSDTRGPWLPVGEIGEKILLPAGLLAPAVGGPRHLVLVNYLDTGCQSGAN